MFNPTTNRIINGICEFCGITAETCEHYSAGQLRPLEEGLKLERSPKAPPVQNVPVMPVSPLTEEEKAVSVEAAEAKKAEVLAAEEIVHVVTEQDLEANPGLEAEVSVGEEVVLSPEETEVTE